jgi:alanyl-tRNA synthetase
MKSHELRSRFLQYFKSHGHTVVESAALIPHQDPTLLFTNAGMVPFKDVFLGKEKRPYTRATSAQKCVRAGGKHNDLENVGFTARHHTFFEMLGNFSFGDYFKKDAIHFAWKFVTEELKLDKKRLYVSVYRDDDEAAELWHKQEGVPRDRISRFGEKDNFWSMGDTGPCGPCTELFYDRGEKYGCGKSTCAVGCDCDRFMEFWNLVFMQYDRSASGTLTPLPKPSVDTGAGLERLASILQDVDSNYDTDLFVDIIQRTKTLLGKNVREPSQVPFRVIADHSRASAFLIADGVTPSNEGRGYVLRRILRRAIRYGKNVGFSKPFLHETTGFVVEQMGRAYPELERERERIKTMVLAEEELFLKTLERGLQLFDEAARDLKAGDTVSGEAVFKLYDTYGFPVDLTRVIAQERKLTIDEAGFETHMSVQRENSRKSWKGSGDHATEAKMASWSEALKSQGKLPVFKGYDTLQATSLCTGMMSPDGDLLQSTAGHSQVFATFAETPFYGESGGQVGDQGDVTAENGSFHARVVDVQKPTPHLIVAHLEVTKGVLRVGDTALQTTAAHRRASTARNHTATHLLHSALREVVGTHVKQAGSLVTPELLRFDFNHHQPVNAEQLSAIEDRVNKVIWANIDVAHEEMSKDAATQKGAIAFFGEKYGDRVRVISVGDVSVELCGGTHVHASGEIHLFKIISESGIAAGVRRIVAKTSEGAFQHLRNSERQLTTVRDQIGASSHDEIPQRLEKFLNSEKELRKTVEKLQAQTASHEAQSIVDQLVRKTEGSYLVARIAPRAEMMKFLRTLGDSIKAKAPDAIAVMVGQDSGTQQVALMIVRGPQQKKASAQALLGLLLPLIGAKGGGKPEMAQASGSDASGIDALVAEAKKWLEEQL